MRSFQVGKGLTQMPLRKARVLVTEYCDRKCEGCCNKYSRIMDQMVDITSFDQIAGYDVICLTGGEPMADPIFLLRCIEAARESFIPKVYVYTALYDPTFFRSVVEKTEGIHFTLHYPASFQDIEDFEEAQNCLSSMQLLDEDDPRTHRLYIDRRVASSVPIIPVVWSRVDVSPWLTEEEVFKRNGPTGLPPGEQLFRLRGYP